MGETSGMVLKVKTEELVSVSNEVESQISAMRQRFDQVAEIVNRSSSYWEGEGQIAYVQEHRSRCDAIETALRRFSENITDLRMIAGVYTAVEAQAVELANVLSGDVIV